MSVTAAPSYDDDTGGSGSAAADAASVSSRTGLRPGDLVVGSALVAVAAHLALRVWMLWPSWFYGDDFALLGEAGRGSASLDHLGEPYAGQLMPVGRALALVVARSGSLDWHVAAVTVLALVLLADLACIWMLVELFGRRAAILLPLALYLTSAVVVPATMWWAAALNQLPLQAVLCAAVAAWARYLRTARSAWWAVAVALVVVGLLSYAKTLLVLVVLAWITLAHFTSGGARTRVRRVARAHAVPIAVLTATAAGYLTWYVVAVPSIVVTDGSGAVAGELARTMLGEALPVGLVGGPWRWGSLNTPVVTADPPAWSVASAWLLLVAVVVVVAIRRRRTGRVWALFVAYCGLAYLLLLTTRSPLVGAVIGGEYRYLTDVMPVAALCLGLATMTVRGADEPTVLRAGSARFSLRSLPVALAVLLAVSGLVSTIGYARVWHRDDVARNWIEAVRGGLAAAGAVDVADRSVPEDVVSPFVAPWNTLGELLPLAGIPASFSRVSSRLAFVGDDGRVVQAVVQPVALGAPGPEEGCGYRVAGGSLTVPLDREVPPGVYWLRIGYLSSTSDTITVSTPRLSEEAQVSKGLGSIFVNLAEGADSVTVTVVDDDTTFCLGDVEAGPLVEGLPW